MEKVFHKKYLSNLEGVESALDGDQVRLKSRHLWLSASIAKNAFGNERQVYAVYYPQRMSLLLAPMSDEAFKTLHESSLLMLKDRNLTGDKSLSLQEIIIDHEINDQDRPLSYTYTPRLKMLQVTLTNTK